MPVDFDDITGFYRCFALPNTDNLLTQLALTISLLIGSVSCSHLSAMAAVKVTLGYSPRTKVEQTEMVIVGGGICGILAAKQCHDRGMKYVLVERTAELGGVWHTMANKTSFLQASLIKN